MVRARGAGRRARVATVGVLYGRYFPATAQYALGYRLAEAALGLARGGIESRDGALTLISMSLCAMRLGQYDVAYSCAERGLDIARSLDDVELIARALSAVGASLHAKDEPLRAIASFQEAVRPGASGEANPNLWASRSVELPKSIASSATSPRPSHFTRSR
jgi:tetratricopeptide (TPR) repeat protein